MNISRMINRNRADATVRARCHLRRSTDGNINRFKKSILDMIAGTVNTDSYDNVPLVDDLRSYVRIFLHLCCIITYYMSDTTQM